MRFVHLKKEAKCGKDDGLIQAGEEAVLVRFKSGVILTFHPQCYLDWNQEQFLLQWNRWRMDNPPKVRKYDTTKRPMGRPKTYKSQVKAHQLVCKIAYHRKAGNVDKVAELEHELDSLRVDKN